MHACVYACIIVIIRSHCMCGMAGRVITWNQVESPLANPGCFCRSLCCQDLAIHLGEDSERYGMCVEQIRVTVGAAAVYLSAKRGGEVVTRGDVCRATGVTEVGRMLTSASGLHADRCGIKVNKQILRNAEMSL